MKRNIRLCAMVVAFVAAQIPLLDRAGCEDIGCTDTETLPVQVILPIVTYGGLLTVAMVAVSLILERARDRGGDRRR